ncbi:MAG: hypothetical protein HW407_1060 [Bacteroidetes bacterium]|nr:hypothetical protein [Bacteroidota bacterium]
MKYGLEAETAYNLWEVEKWCFLTGKCESRFYHLREMIRMTMPGLEWNEWLERQMGAYCEDSYAHKIGSTVFRSVNLVGCASSGKTFSAGVFAFHWWLAAPWESIVILTSTTREMVGSRIWPIIRKCHNSARENLGVVFGVKGLIEIGNMVDSKKMLQVEKGNEKNTIKAIAVRDGETNKAEANIRGQHARRILIVVDEAGDTPEAIFGTIPNLRTGCEDFTIITIGNPDSRLNPHGKCCEPAHGFGSRKAGVTTWKTKGG